MKHLHDLPVLVLGLGASGLAMARWCARCGAQVTVADTREAPPQLAQLRAEQPQVRFVAGAFDASLLDGANFSAVYRSPGLAPQVIAPVFIAAGARGISVGSEIDLYSAALLALRAAHGYAPAVLAITGTNGKTTTKELVSAVLGEKFNVMFTQGNFNNDVGVPKTLFRLSPENEIAVVEMGASHPGDIRKLVEYVEPTCDMITNVGRAHLQGFGSFEGVKKTKGELYDYLAANDALVFINADNEHLMQMAEQRNINRLITYGKDENCDVWGEVISCAPFLKFRWRTESFDWHEVQTHLIGSYNIDNMLAAITIGLHFDVKPQQIDHALENYIPSNNRSQLEETAHNKLVVDAYNANPSSMAAAIENFRVMDVPHKMAILGQMGELGEVSHEEHQKVVDQLQAAGLENVWLVGDEFKDIPCSYRKFQNVEEVKEALKANQPHDHYILIKGSNSVKLFQLPELL